jgi:hypothetical protein
MQLEEYFKDSLETEETQNIISKAKEIDEFIKNLLKEEITGCESYENCLETKINSFLLEQKIIIDYKLNVFFNGCSCIIINLLWRFNLGSDYIHQHFTKNIK